MSKEGYNESQKAKMLLSPQTMEGLRMTGILLIFKGIYQTLLHLVSISQ